MSKTGVIALCLLLSVTIVGKIDAQNKPVKFNLNETGDNYVKFTGFGQIWLRNTNMNPGSTINDIATDQYTDISIRRLRFQVIGQLTDKVFFYTQFGQNNFNYHSTKYTGAFFHDFVLEYKLAQEKVHLGGGLAGWSGLARYASPSVGSVLTLDAPLFLQTTNGVNDQFIRKLSVYAKGQLGKFDYRVMFTQPMTVTGGTSAPTSTAFDFANTPPKKQFQGYFKYMFWDKESNLTPYHAGTYFGNKRIFNIGAGFISQSDAMWALDTVAKVNQYENMLLTAVDVFLDNPLDNGSILTVYVVGTNYQLGSNYIRYVGVNNPASGTTGVGVGGDAYPMIGNGNSVYAQVGYLIGKSLSDEGAKLQPFGSFQLSDYDRYNDKVAMYELGANLLLQGSSNSKLSVVYQSRPVFDAAGNLDTRKGMSVLQYQVSF